MTPWIRSLALMCLFLLGCRVSVQAPAEVEQPARVYLAHYDRYHTSLVIPGEGVATEFTYGDLDLFAHFDQSFWPAFKGMSFPTQGVLGLREVPWDGLDREQLRARLDNVESCNRVSALTVERARLRALEEQLRASFEVAREGAIHNAELGLTFVEHPRSYTFLHNCNHQLAAWLERLDCRVSGMRAMARFEVEAAP